MKKIQRGRRRSDIDAHVGRRVKMRRMELGLSQQNLGTRLGVSFQQIQKYERGTNRIGAGRLFEIAQVLGVGIDYFYIEAENVPMEEGTGGDDVARLGQFVMSAEGLMLCRAFMHIKDAATRKRIVDLLHSLGDK